MEADSRDQLSDEERERTRYRELLGEVRTIIPGAQVLFAFLLTAPFSSRFSEVDEVGRAIFTISLLSVAAATVLFLAPAAYHRLADQRDRRQRLNFGVRTTLSGMFLLGVAVVLAIFVVVRFMFHSTPFGLMAGGFAAVLGILMWLIFPLRHR
ncbi:amine oxidase [Proteobacteria bacterium 005FR1]|nr:amine oxidase [Proteobacteria bacterium 005FR1]